MEVFWNQLIVEKFSKDVKIDKNKIKSEISKNNLQKEIQLSEILFSIDKNEKLGKNIILLKKSRQQVLKMQHSFTVYLILLVMVVKLGGLIQIL